MAKSVKQYQADQRFINWIVAAESTHSDVSEEYENARKYYEQDQEPANTPASKTYIIENIVTDVIDYFVGKMVGGDINPSISGGGKIGEALKELIMNIIERNMFMELTAEAVLNMFYCEGLAGISVPFNPFKISPYGIGMPEIQYLRIGELLLDPAGDFLHDNDLFRIQVESLLVDEAEAQFDHLSGLIQPTQRTNQLTTRGLTQEKYCDLYTIQFIRKTFVPVEEHKLFKDGKRKIPPYVKPGTKVQEDCYYQIKLINKDQSLVAEEEAETGINRFSLIPVIHTPRFKSKSLPYGLGKKMKSLQDEVNITSSVALDAIKHDVKNTKFAKGFTKAEIEDAKKELPKTDGLIHAANMAADLKDLNRPGISTALIQWYQWMKEAINSATGRYREREAAEGSKSGRAVFLLQEEGANPELVRKLHFVKSMTDMVYCLLEYTQKRMKQPFSINRNIDGEEKQIYFNYGKNEQRQLESPIDKNDSYNVDTGDGIINELLKVDIDTMDIKIDIIMNQAGRRQQEMNNAYLAQKAGLLSRADTTKEIYPKSWKEKFENKFKEDQALALVAKIQQMNPNGIQILNAMVNDIMQKMAETEAMEKESREL